MINKDIILQVQNVSKQYQLGTFGTKTIGGDVHRWWTTKVLGKEDPFLKVGQVNDRTSKEKADFVWALKDINFEVKRGEVLGIIGKNGAGKSTLLKLLSRITSPTTGTIKSAGRMASLLEVGTGFHPELTGRENIFLNGAILGMTKNEIKRKLDEIIDFSGCALYIDTPVKRYSSGMTVRLGFAVAAFLDPEILVVDEVLAVGDAEFQKKAIGKMKDVSKNEGRTVLFVSHNMDAIDQLCESAVIIKNGHLIDHRSFKQTKEVINEYLIGESKTDNSKMELDYSDLQIQDTKIKTVRFTSNNCNFKFTEELEIIIHIIYFEKCLLSIEVTNIYGNRILLKELEILKSGDYYFKLKSGFLTTGDYKFKLYLSRPNIEIIQTTDYLIFSIVSTPTEFLHYSTLPKEVYPLGYVYYEQDIRYSEEY